MKPVSTVPKPFYRELRTDRTYRWCACGRSTRQPYCDGASHVGTGFVPFEYLAKQEGEEVLFCGCKRTSTPPFCDGTHNNLLDVYPEDDPDSVANRAVQLVLERAGPRAFVDGGCFTYSLGAATPTVHQGMRYCTIISGASGAQHQSLFHAEVPTGRSPIMQFGDREVVLFIAAGSGEVTISGRSFAVADLSGVYVRAGEAFSITASEPAGMRLFIAACPVAEEIGFVAGMPRNFDDTEPQRIVEIDPSQRHAMANRFFQMLVDRTIGSRVVTQFIGHIPYSKALPHRHLYEESLIILRGEGMLWTETRRTPVAAGDVVFLPRKQLHSLQCTAPSGMDLVGAIYPGDNPSINY